MLEHNNLENSNRQLNRSLNKNNELNASRNSNALSDSFYDLSQDIIAEQQQRPRLGNLKQIEGYIRDVLKDRKKMARFGKVIAAASLFDQAITDKEKIDSLTSIRESAANYLLERKRSSDQNRKLLCERIIIAIDSYANENHIEIGHSTAYMIDETRHMTQDEIDNEIRLAHSLTGASPLSDVTKERRDSFKKKIVDVRLANSYMADIEKWKNQKSELLRQKKAELGIGEGVNEGYDSVCVDAVLWYGRIYNHKDESMTTMLSRLTIDEDKGATSINIKARQIETILADIMSWNMDDFTFAKTEDFLHRRNRGETEKEHFLRLYSKLQLAKNADRLLGELLRMRDNESYNAPFDFSEKTLEELKDRLKIYKEIEKDYSERLSIISSPYYALLLESDMSAAMTEKSDNKLLSMKQEKNIPNSRLKTKVPPEFANYIDKLHAKKKRMDKTKLNDYFTRNTHIENSIDNMLKKKGITVNERKTRIIAERTELENKLTQDLAAFKQEQMQEQEYSENLRKAIENESPEVERQNIDGSMRQVQGRSFVPVVRPADRMGKLGKLKAYGFAGVRWITRATVGKIAGVVGLVLGAGKQLQESERVANAQKKRIHGIVPGTKDERFADEHITGSDDDQEVLYDTRRAPLVWERLSAGDPDDPPEVAIMAKQSIKGSRATDPVKMGHAMIGLSYSRFNKITGRKERYKLKIGFYPGGGANKLPNTVMMAANAMMSGQISDDADSSFDIARRYTVTTGAINRILLAAEKYADGGYGYYQRSCTTFVADMAKLADIPMEDAGKNELLDVKGTIGNLASIGVAGSDGLYYAAANNISDKLQTKDKSYQNYGQKLMTKEDLDRYYDSTKKTSNMVISASPGQLGEDLRETNDKGELTSFNEKYNDFEFLTEEQRNIFVSDLQENMHSAGSSLVDDIIRRLEEQHLPIDEMREKLAPIRQYINLDDILLQDGKTIPKAAKDMHKKIRKNMNLINSVYRDTLKNDSLLNKAVMDYLGLCEVTLSILDKTYQDNVRYEYNSETGGLIEDYQRFCDFMCMGDEQIEGEVSPLEFYGYLKIGKTLPQMASDRKELAILQNSDGLTDEQYARRRLLQKERETALDFGYANIFNLSKDEFSEKDIEDAFKNLPLKELKKEDDVIMGGALLSNYRPSLIQQALILGKVCDGISTIEFSDLKDERAFVSEMDNYILTKMQAKQENMKTILKAYISGKDDSSGEALANAFVMEPLTALANSALRKQVPNSSQRERLVTKLPFMTNTWHFLKNTINDLRSNGNDDNQ